MNLAYYRNITVTFYVLPNNMVRGNYALCYNRKIHTLQL